MLGVLGPGVSWDVLVGSFGWYFFVWLSMLGQGAAAQRLTQSGGALRCQWICLSSCTVRQFLETAIFPFPVHIREPFECNSKRNRETWDFLCLSSSDVPSCPPMPSGRWTDHGPSHHGKISHQRQDARFVVYHSCGSPVWIKTSVDVKMF